MFLCETCQSIKPILIHYTPGQEIKTEDLTVHHLSAKALKDAAREGCHICRSLWARVVISVPVENLLKMRPATYCIGRAATHSRESTLVLGKIIFYRNVQSKEEHKPTAIEIFTCFPYSPGKSTLENGFTSELIRALDSRIHSPEASISCHTSSNDVFNLAKAWFERCVSGHERCNHIQRQGWYPTRLLDLRTGTSTPKLIVTNEHNLIGRYATLSHCWGGYQVLRLLTNNIKELKTGILLPSLPKTFRHAIHVAKRLNIRYLWIDTLCIIQDSVEDWLFESTSMGNVYRNSMLNLSAAGAENGSEGCFFKRSTHNVGPLLEYGNFKNFDWRKGSGFTQDTLASSSNNQCYLIDTGFWERLCIFSPIFNRAWILQERLLAPRVLHFGKEQLFWECRTDNYCETFPEGLPIVVKNSWVSLTKRVYDRFQSGIFFGTGNLQIAEKYSTPVKIQILWEILVRDYSKCDLTKPEDKLIALSGIAEDFGNLLKKVSTPTQYVAGIWKSHLPQGLLWTADSNGPQVLARPKEYRAPTWSWASLDGLIKWDSYRWEEPILYTAEVHMVHVSSPGIAFGQVTGGILEISGRLWKLESFFIPQKTMKLYAIPSFDMAFRKMMHNSSSIPNGIPIVFTDEGTDICRENWDDLYGLLIICYQSPSVFAPCMLAVVPCESRSNIFRRVGIVHASQEHILNWYTDDANGQQMVRII